MKLLQRQIINEGITKHKNQEELKLQQSWEEVATQEEKLWQHKSRINCLKCIAFFHKSMIQRKRNN